MNTICRSSRLQVLALLTAISSFLLINAPGEMMAQPQAEALVDVDDGDVTSYYANFSRVTGTPEEVIIDFGLNTQPSGRPEKPLNIERRIVLSPYTAKRLFLALQTTIERHEGAFGAIEIDVNKRLRPQ